MTLLFLNSIGGFEVIFIILAVLILFGPNSLPGIAKTLGKGMREVRSASNEIKREIHSSTAEIRKDLNANNPLNDVKKLIEEPSPDHTPKDFKRDNPETSLTPPKNVQPKVSDQPQNNDPAT